MGGRRLLYSANVDWYFASHFLALAKAARDSGWEVSISGEDTGKAGPIGDAGFDFLPVPLVRHGVNPLQDARAAVALALLYRKVRPGLVHHVAMKPVVYGPLAALALPKAAVVNTLPGLGWVFSDDPAARRPRRVAETLMRAGLRRRRSLTIVQNSSIAEYLVGTRLVDRERIVVIPGSGVDTTAYVPSPEPSGPPVVLLAGRMLVDKGVHDFVEMARVLTHEGKAARFVLVGGPDPGNPASLTEEDLLRLAEHAPVEWWGRRDDMASVLAEAAVVVLPSRHEGMPRVLSEAAACGRPSVATDIPGCRDICRPGVSGALVPVGDVGALAGAVANLLGDRAQRARLGAGGRRLAETEFSLDVVIERTLGVYDRVIRRDGS